MKIEDKIYLATFLNYRPFNLLQKNQFENLVFNFCILIIHKYVNFLLYINTNVYFVKKN